MCSSRALQGLEKYVMSKVWRQTFGTCDEDRERDERYQRLMQAGVSLGGPLPQGVGGSCCDIALGITCS